MQLFLKMMYKRVLLRLLQQSFALRRFRVTAVLTPHSADESGSLSGEYSKIAEAQHVARST